MALSSSNLVSATHVFNATRDSVGTTSASIAIQTGDILVVKVATEDSAFTPAAPTNSGAALTWTSRAATGAVSNREQASIFTATADSNRSLTITINTTGSGTHYRGATINVWRGVKLATTPATNSTKTGTGAPSATVTTAAAGSIVDSICGDWNVASGSRTYRSSATEQTVRNNGAIQYETFYQLAASAGSQTIGLTAPSSQNWSMVGIEIQEASTPPQTVSPQLVSSAESVGQPTVAPGAVAVAPALLAGGSSVGQPTPVPGAVAVAPQAVGSSASVEQPLPLGQTVTGTGIGSGEAFGTLTVNAGLTVGPSGITSAEAFGDATFTAGAVTVTLTGVASGETFGTASVTPLLQPTGITSAEAFGDAAVTAGVVAVTVTGIASGEAFGSGTVSVGSVSVTATGIASGEAFGAAQVNLQIVGSGIASGEAFGSPTLGIGGVSVTLTGIASGEAFGDANLTVTIDPTVRGTSRLARRDVYELVCVARIMSASSAPTFLEVERIEWKTLTWTNELSAPQGLTARCPVSSVNFPVAQRLADPARLPTELWLTRNGQMVFAGPLLGWRRNGDDLDLTAAGLMKYLQVMFVLTDPELRFDQVDQHTIAAQLVNQWQNTVPYGNFGIDTSSVAPSGTLRDRSYVRNEIHEVLRRVQELGQVDGGFDSEVDPTTRKLQLWTPTKGVDRSSGGDAIVLDDRNINSLDVMCSVAPGDLASMAFGASSAGGSDTSLWSQAVNDDLRAAYGAAGVTGSWSDISEQTTLDGHVSALLGARDRALLVPGPKARVTTDSDIGSYDVGDTIACEMDSLLGVSGAFRIRKRTVDVDESGQETATLEFV